MYQLKLTKYLVIISIVISIIVMLGVTELQHKTIYEQKKDIPEQFSSSLNMEVTKDVEHFKIIIEQIQRRSDIAELFKAGKKTELYEKAESLYKTLNNNIDITHMYFIKPNGQVLLRMHQFHRDGDIINRETFKRAQETQQISYGLEFGILKNYTLRVVKPWYFNGELIGYFEIGEEIDKIIYNLSKLLRTDIFIAINKEVYKNNQKYIEENSLNKKSIGNYYLVYGTFDEKKLASSELDSSFQFTHLHLDGKNFLVTNEELKDISGKKLGYFVFATDTSYEHSLMYKFIALFSIVLIVITGFLIFLGNRLLQNREDSINKLTEELDSLNKNLQKEIDRQIKELREKDKAILHHSKKSSMGDLIGIIAHQLKQPLNAISMSKELIVEDFEFNELTEESIRSFDERVTKQIDFMSTSIDDLRNFFRPDKEPKPYSIKHAIEKAIGIISGPIRSKGIDLRVSIINDMEIKGFENELQQVILNIVNNAKDAIIERKVESPFIEIKVAAENTNAVITIEDNGGGIPEEIIGKIFDSYFTTKGEKGTGIGLNLAKMIVEDSMGGTISVVNNENGAFFTIDICCII